MKHIKHNKYLSPWVEDDGIYSLEDKEGKSSLFVFSKELSPIDFGTSFLIHCDFQNIFTVELLKIKKRIKISNVSNITLSIGLNLFDETADMLAYPIPTISMSFTFKHLRENIMHFLRFLSVYQMCNTASDMIMNGLRINDYSGYLHMPILFNGNIITPDNRYEVSMESIDELYLFLDKISSIEIPSTTDEFMRMYKLKVDNNKIRLVNVNSCPYLYLTMSKFNYKEIYLPIANNSWAVSCVITLYDKYDLSEQGIFNYEMPSNNGSAIEFILHLELICNLLSIRYHAIARAKLKIDASIFSKYDQYDDLTFIIEKSVDQSIDQLSPNVLLKILYDDSSRIFERIIKSVLME